MLERSEFVGQSISLVMVSSIVGNFLAAAIARVIGYRWTIMLMCIAYGLSMLYTYGTVRGPDSSFYHLILMGVSQGVFAMFRMYLPPLFPTLLQDHGDWLLLQYRSRCVRRRDRHLWAFLEGRRPPHGTLLRRLHVFAGGHLRRFFARA